MAEVKYDPNTIYVLQNPIFGYGAVRIFCENAEIDIFITEDRVEPSWMNFSKNNFTTYQSIGYKIIQEWK